MNRIAELVAKAYTAALRKDPNAAELLWQAHAENVKDYLARLRRLDRIHGERQ